MVIHFIPYGSYYKYIGSLKPEYTLVTYKLELVQFILLEIIDIEQTRYSHDSRHCIHAC